MTVKIKPLPFWMRFAVSLLVGAAGGLLVGGITLAFALRVFSGDAAQARISAVIVFAVSAAWFAYIVWKSFGSEETEFRRLRRS